MRTYEITNTSKSLLKRMKDIFKKYNIKHRFYGIRKGANISLFVEYGKDKETNT